MPSTTSSTVSADFDSSTVITPSLPTFSIASAIRLPIVLSLLEAIVATCAISFLSLVDLLSFFSSSLTASTAASMPRLRRSEEHTSELQSRRDLVCRLLLEKKKKIYANIDCPYSLPDSGSKRHSSSITDRERHHSNVRTYG